MRIAPIISTLSALIVIVLGSTTVWTSPASAATDDSGRTAVRQTQPKLHKCAYKKAHRKLKAAQRSKKVQSARRLQPTRSKYRASASRYSRATIPVRTPRYNWSTTATYGRSATQTGAPAIAPQARAGSPAQTGATLPRVQGAQAPPTVCYGYNPCTTCWSVPYYPWTAPATYGAAPQPATAPPTYALPPAQPAPSYAQPPAQPAHAPSSYCEAAQQPRAAPGRTTVCSNTSWWSTWPFSYLRGLCY